LCFLLLEKEDRPPELHQAVHPAERGEQRLHGLGAELRTTLGGWVVETDLGSSD
jgi:hypothetical protein